ncbi:MAG: hypothetical protein C6I01_02665 [Epsilonproteobacteria bacterium]|nr:hypothetical protein [Campylobacterota bacterium]NPA89572.1 hypothetical protein [Campylobacterota bacterium]
MVAKVFASVRNSFLFCLEDLEKEIRRNFSSYDFLIFSIHPSFPREDVNQLIQKVFGTTNYLAFSSISSFWNEKIIEKGVVCCVMKMEREGSVNLQVLDSIFEKESVNQLADYFNTHSNSFHFFLGNYSESMGFFIEEVSSRLQYQPVNNIVGGLCSTTGVQKKTAIFVDNKIIEDGVAILSFHGFDVATGISLGFQPYGITYTIAKGEGVKIVSVDDGKEFYHIAKDFLKDIPNPDIRYLWYAPIYILDEDEGYLATLRTFKSIKEDGVEFYGPIKKGQKFKLSFAGPEEILNEDKRVATEIKPQVPYPELTFNVSCVARQYVLEDKQHKEIDIYTNIFNTHLFGFFSFGEVGPDSKYNRLKLFNETSLVAILREK